MTSETPRRQNGVKGQQGPASRELRIWHQVTAVNTSCEMLGSVRSVVTELYSEVRSQRSSVLASHLLNKPFTRQSTLWVRIRTNILTWSLRNQVQSKHSFSDRGSETFRFWNIFRLYHNFYSRYKC